jgi:putative acetyltransferase
VNSYYREFWIRDWQPGDRTAAADLIRSVLSEYRLVCEPEGADRDVLSVEESYWAKGGEFWVVERDQRLVGTAAYYPVARGTDAVEIRKMYLLPEARGQGLGRYLLQNLEKTIIQRGYQQIWLETASVLFEAVKLYESSGYQPATGVETKRCDRLYTKLLLESSRLEERPREKSESV